MRDALFKEVKKVINSPENLRWLHKEANNAKLRVFSDLISLKKGELAALPEYGLDSIKRDSFYTDKQLLPAVSLYFQNTFNSAVQISQSIHRVLASNPQVKSMLELSEDQFVQTFYDDMFQMATHVQDRAASFPELNFQKWEIPTLDQVRVEIELLCPRSGPLRRRCLQSTNNTGSNG